MKTLELQHKNPISGVWQRVRPPQTEDDPEVTITWSRFTKEDPSYRVVECNQEEKK